MKYLVWTRRCSTTTELPLPWVEEQGYHWCERPWHGLDLLTASLQQTLLAPAPASRPLAAEAAPSLDQHPRFLRPARALWARHPDRTTVVSPHGTYNTRSDWTPPRHSQPPVSVFYSLRSPLSLVLLSDASAYLCVIYSRHEEEEAGCRFPRGAVISLRDIL